MQYFIPHMDERKPDYALLFIASFLMFIGLVFSYSLSIFAVEYYAYSQFHFFIRQFIAVAIGIFFMWGLAHIKAEVIFNQWKLPWRIFLISSILIMIMPILPTFLTTESGGATRWIRLPGFSISPVEFFKIGFIFVISSFLYRKNPKLKEIRTLKSELIVILPSLLILGFFASFIAVAQKDLGNVVLIAIILLMMFVFADRSIKLIMALVSTGLGAFALLVIIAPHRIDRIKSWWSSVQDTFLSPFSQEIQEMFRTTEYSEPYQVTNSISAIYNGGWFGTGVGEGNLKLGFLGEVHTDFVLAGMTEEIGILGLIALLIGVIFVILRIFKIARRVENEMYHYFCVGVGVMIGFSYLINSYGIAGLIPIKGLAVPFLSYGGSSVIALGISLGIVLSISKEINK